MIYVLYALHLMMLLTQPMIVFLVNNSGYECSKDLTYFLVILEDVNSVIWPFLP